MFGNLEVKVLYTTRSVSYTATATDVGKKILVFFSGGLVPC